MERVVGEEAKAMVQRLNKEVEENGETLLRSLIATFVLVHKHFERYYMKVYKINSRFIGH